MKPNIYFLCPIIDWKSWFLPPKTDFSGASRHLFCMLFYFFIFKVQTRNLMIQITQSVAQLMFIWWRTFPFPFSDSNAIKNCKIKNKHYYYYYKKILGPEKNIGFLTSVFLPSWNVWGELCQNWGAWIWILTKWIDY